MDSSSLCNGVRGTAHQALVGVVWGMSFEGVWQTGTAIPVIYSCASRSARPGGWWPRADSWGPTYPEKKRSRVVQA